MMKKFEYIEHTGDIGLKVYGNSLKDLFENAALGMFAIIADTSKIAPKIIKKIEVEGRDLVELFVSWLSELNFRFETEEEIFSRFKITKITNQYLQAEVQGEKYNHQRHEILRGIKAVTYHELYIKEKDGRWEAQVIFDI